MMERNGNDTGNTAVIHTEATAPEDSLSAFIRPPVEGLDVPYQAFTVNSARGGDFTYSHTGSELRISPNSFMDENGGKVTGKVEVKYREMHDVVDFLISGIPMTYDSGGTRYHFESAGMVDVRAYQNGKQLKMAPGKTMHIRMASRYDGTDYNLYNLDTTARNWVFLGKDKIERDWVIEMNMLTEVFGGPGEHYSAIAKLTEAFNAQLSSVRNDIAQLKKQEPKAPREASKNNYRFELDVIRDEFPEFANYEGMVFEIDPERNKDFRSSLMKVTWAEIRLKEDEAGKYVIEVKRRLPMKYTFEDMIDIETRQFVVYPVFEGKNYEEARRIFDEKYAGYQSRLDERLAEEKKIQEEYNAKE